MSKVGRHQRNLAKHVKQEKQINRQFDRRLDRLEDKVSHRRGEGRRMSWGRDRFGGRDMGRHDGRGGNWGKYDGRGGNWGRYDGRGGNWGRHDSGRSGGFGGAFMRGFAGALGSGGGDCAPPEADCAPQRQDCDSRWGRRGGLFGAVSRVADKVVGGALRFLFGC